MSASIKPPEKRAPSRGRAARSSLTALSITSDNPSATGSDGLPMNSPLRPAPTRAASVSAQKKSSHARSQSLSSDMPARPASPKLPPFSMDSLPKSVIQATAAMSDPSSDDGSRSSRKNTASAASPPLRPAPLPPPPPRHERTLSDSSSSSRAAVAALSLPPPPSSPPPAQAQRNLSEAATSAVLDQGFSSSLPTSLPRSDSEIPPPPEPLSPTTSMKTHTPAAAVTASTDAAPPPQDLEKESISTASPPSKNTQRHIRSKSAKFDRSSLDEDSTQRILQISLPNTEINNGGHLSFRCSPLASFAEMEQLLLRQLAKRSMNVNSPGVQKWLSDFRDAWELHLEEGNADTERKNPTARSALRDVSSLFRWIDGDAPSTPSSSHREVTESPSVPSHSRSRSLSHRIRGLVKSPDSSTSSLNITTGNKCCTACPWAVLPPKATFCFNCGLPATNEDISDLTSLQRKPSNLVRGAGQAQCPSCHTAVTAVSLFCSSCGSKLVDPVNMVVNFLKDLQEQKLWYVGVNQTKGLRGFRVFTISNSAQQGKQTYAQLTSEMVKLGKPGILLVDYQHSARGPNEETLVFVSFVPKNCDSDEKQKFLEILQDIQETLQNQASPLKAYLSGSSAKDIDEQSLRKCLQALGVKI